jgi:hypothetical protein
MEEEINYSKAVEEVLGEKIPVKKGKGGRPSPYQNSYIQIAEVILKLGGKDKDLASAFGVTEQTINNWKIKHPEFFESCAQAKRLFDTDKVERAFMKNILGFETEDIHTEVRKDEKTGKDIKVVKKVKRKVAGSVTAQMFWLERLRKTVFKNQSVDINVNDESEKIDLSKLTDEELLKLQELTEKAKSDDDKQ